ncbi:MAG: protein kinase [Acidobacteriota bacterium]
MPKRYLDMVGIGKTVSHYRILERLGGGGMGIVYKAEDTRLKRLVALKFLSPALTSERDARQRFETEAQAASAIDHPHVCTVHEISETDDGQVFICMAYCQGETLRQRIAKGPLPVEDAVVIAVQIAEGLAAAHRRGVIHRDVKPANVILADGEAVKLVDFGLALLADRSRISRHGLMVGTIGYMAPEQARGEPVDHRADLWSLGVVLYEMLAGTLPFSGPSDTPVLRAIETARVPPVQGLRPEVPAELSAVIERCLEKDPGRRFQSAEQVAEALRRVRRSLRLSSASTLTGAPAARRPRWAVRTLAAGGALLALLVVAAILPSSRGLKSWLTDRGGGPAHIAVLPLNNVGADSGTLPFCDGIAEIVASKLTSMGGHSRELWVVPLAELRQRGVASPSEARRVFGVNLSVTGSVQRIDDRFVLTLNLVDTGSLRQLRSRVLDRRVDRLASLEGDLVEALAAMFEVELPSPVRSALAASGTEVSAAYQAYVEGRGALEAPRGTPDPAGAAALLRRAVELDPAFAPAHAALAEALLAGFADTRDPSLVTDAATHVALVAAMAPDSVLALVVQGRLAVARGEHEAAAAAFSRALALEPTHLGAEAGLAAALEDAGRLEEAERALIRSVELRPGYWLGHNALGVFYFRHAKYGEAEAQFRKVVEISPENARGYNNLGGVLLQQGRPAEALPMFERSAALSPQAVTWSNVATLRFRAGRFGEAAQCYERAVALEPGDYLLWGNLGAARRWVPGAGDSAREAFERALELAERVRAVNPADATVLADVASYRAMLGDRDGAAALQRGLESRAWDDADLAFRVGLTWEDLGDRVRALRMVNRAIELGLAEEEVRTAPGLARLREDPRFRGSSSNAATR